MKIVYLSDDGNYYATQEEAIRADGRHVKIEALKKLFDGSYFTQFSSTIRARDLYELMVANAEALKKIL